MKLAAWLEQSDQSDADFARRIKVSRQALSRYKAGERTPRPKIIARIQVATNDAVRPDDFFDMASAA
jgi:transcriptional regulator with XRE-family HTH domain